MATTMIGDSAYTATGGTFNHVMKEWYENAMESLVPQMFPLYDWLKENGSVVKPKPQGKYIVFDVQTKLGSGAGYRGEGDYLPTPAATTGVQGKVAYLRGLKGRVEISAEAMDIKNGPGAFANIMDSEIQGLLTEFKYLGSAAMWGNGDGILAKTSTQLSGTATFTAETNETYALCYPGTRWLYEGLSVIPVISTSAYAVDTSWTAATTISAITSDTAATLATTKSTAAATRYLVEHKCTDNTNSTEMAKGSVTLATASSFRGPMGINAMVDNGTFASSYCGISESTYPQWMSTISHNSGTARSITTDLLYKLFYKFTRYSGTMSPEVTAWTNTDVYREIVDLMENQIQFKPRELKPGFQHFDVMIDGVGIPFKLDHMCPSYIYFLDPKYIRFAQKSAPQIADNHGSSMRWVADKDCYEQVWRWIFQLYTNNRRKHAALRDISCTIASV